MIKVKTRELLLSQPNSTSNELELDFIMVRNPPQPPPPPPETLRPLIFGMQLYFDPTRKTTSQKKSKTT
jgi:hypothetical protein